MQRIMIPTGTAAEFSIGIEQEDGLVRGVVVHVSVEGVVIRRDGETQRYMEEQFRLRNEEIDRLLMPPPSSRPLQTFTKEFINNRENLVIPRLTRQVTQYIN